MTSTVAAFLQIPSLEPENHTHVDKQSQLLVPGFLFCIVCAWSVLPIALCPLTAESPTATMGH
jgi:hypothetical protein